jgi:hypothetical protein
MVVSEHGMSNEAEAAEGIIPVKATRRRPYQVIQPIPLAVPRILVTGSSGVVAGVLIRRLSAKYEIRGVDVLPAAQSLALSREYQGSVGDRELLGKAAEGVEFILHLATGAGRGWAGLVEVEIEGTRNVLDVAIAAGARRVIIASTNHVNGWDEIDFHATGHSNYPLSPSAPLRPDGLYASAKLFAEALGRSAAEYAGLGVSVLRIGTVRATDKVEAYVHDPEFDYLGSSAVAYSRLNKTWLSHNDLTAIVQEEMHATELFRLRFAASSEEYWSRDLLVWKK